MPIAVKKDATKIEKEAYVARKDEHQKPDLDYWYDHQNEWLTPDDLKVRPDRFIDELYTKASQDFENPEVERTVRQLVVDWEEKNIKNWELWKKVLSYSYAGQELTLKRLGNKWDKIWHEHKHYQKGKDLVEKGLKKGIFKRGKEGAIVTNLKKYNLPDTVVIKSDKTALYITQDLALTQLKINKFHPDHLYWVIGPEQSLALKQMFAVCEQLGIAKLKNLTHIAFGFMSIKGQGKMSSRKGNVIYIDDLLDKAKIEVAKKIKGKLSKREIAKISEEVGIGAVKYSILKVGRLQDIAFDFKESLSLEGNSGPYLQYTYTRTQSVLAKTSKKLKAEANSLNQEEMLVAKKLVKFPEIVEKAALNFSPNTLAEYLYDLSSSYNTFYNKLRIIASDNEAFRLALTSATGQVLKNGLTLLGIKTPEKM